MLIQKIRIRGAIGIKKGMGLDEIEIDFENKTGLIALSGPNGRGKTTILELMSPYRTFASRKGALNHHFHLRDSLIETWFEFNGKQFHTIKKIDAGSDRSEAFIEVDGESVVNGKVKEYDKYILNLFGSQVLFYNSVFCAQGSDNFADMTTGEIKNLFVEFLRLDRLAAYEEQSKKAIRFYDEKKAILDNEIDNIKNSIEKLSGIDQDSETLLKSNARIQASIAEEVALIEESHFLLEKLKKTKVLNESNKEKIKDLDERTAKLEIEKDKTKRERIFAENNHNKAISEIEKERESFSSIIGQKELIEKASVVLVYSQGKEKYFSECFECVLDSMNDLDQQIKKLEAEQLNPLLATKTGFEKDEALLELTGKSENYEEALRKAKERLTALLVNKRYAENDIGLAGYKKDVEICKEKIAMAIDPECISTTCPALESIKDAKKQLPVLEFSLLSRQNEIDAKIREIDAEIKISEASVIKIKSDLEKVNADKDERIIFVKKNLGRINPKIESLEKEVRLLVSESLQINSFKVFYRESRDKHRVGINSATNLAKRLPDLKIAEGKIKQLDARKFEITSAWLEKKEKFDNTFEAKILEIKDLNDQTLLIDEKINVTVNVDIRVKGKLIADKQQEKKELKDIISKNNEKLAVIKNDLQQKENFEKDLQVKIKLQSKLKKEIVDWTYLKISCSKTGLQALEIDGAAPLITKEANSLLEMTFGLDFQIKIVTQDQESGKEVFWVMVIRGDGAEDKFENLSGGQKVWIAKALSLGMTLVSKHKSGKAFQTLFADEADGALDRERAIEFIGLSRSMMQSGSFDTCMYISHNPDVVAMADYILDFSGDVLEWR